MTLLEAMTKFSDNTDVFVFLKDREVARYDGKNSIDERYNECEVEYLIYLGNSNRLHIHVKQQ